MKILRIFILLFSFFVINFFSLSEESYGQPQRPYGEFSGGANKSTEKKLLKSARREFDYGNYKEASQKYSELLKLDSTNPLYNFEIAQTYYNNFRQPQSIPYYENAIRYSTDSLGEAYYFLANAYHLAGKFDLAQKNYKTYLTILNVYGTDLLEEEESELKDDLKHKIEMCDNGQLLFKSPADKITLDGKTRSFRIINMGKNINTDFDDYGAVLSANDSVMYFTSRRYDNTGGKLDWDDKFFEDIYVSGLGKNGWGKSFGIGAPINSDKHEGIISISADGKTIYFYKGVKQGTFFFTNLVGGAWTKPAILYEKSDINTKAWETSFFGFVVSGNELYVVSDREGGIGGRDIYISQKQSDGAWGPLVNLGEPINSKYDEDAPFIASDGKTMYFSSNGHNSMGGFDIFKSERQGQKWSEPLNLGVPFNTPGEDIYFVVGNKSDRAYYSSSSKASDDTKDMDIYMIDLCDDIPETILAGITFGITSGTITVEEKESGQKIGGFKVENGKYSIRLEHGKDYRFTLTMPDIQSASMDVSIPPLCKVYDLYQELEFPQPGQPLVVKNAFFDIEKEANGMNYSEFLAKADKNMLTNYSEVSVETIPTAIATATTAATTTVTATTATTTVTAGTIIASTQTTTATSGTTTASTQTTTTTSGTTTAATHTTTATSGSGTTTASTQTTTTTSGTITASTPTTTATHTTTSTSGTTTTTATTSGTTTTTTISINNILFDYDKSAIKEEFKSELDKAADFLKNTNKKAKIEVAGHTDSKGSDEYNLALSKRRANAVANYLVSKGISKSRIKTAGYGESKPVASNENPDGSDNPDGRIKNRRTEIVVNQ